MFQPCTFKIPIQKRPIGFSQIFPATFPILLFVKQNLENDKHFKKWSKSVQPFSIDAVTKEIAFHFYYIEIYRI